jgi:hypothetical protein
LIHFQTHKKLVNNEYSSNYSTFFIRWLSNYCKLGSNKVIKLEFGFSRLLSLKLETSVNLFYGNINISLASYYSKWIIKTWYDPKKVKYLEHKNNDSSFVSCLQRFNLFTYFGFFLSIILNVTYFLIQLNSQFMINNISIYINGILCSLKKC